VARLRDCTAAPPDTIIISHPLDLLLPYTTARTAAFAWRCRHHLRPITLTGTSTLHLPVLRVNRRVSFCAPRCWRDVITGVTAPAARFLSFTYVTSPCIGTEEHGDEGGRRWPFLKAWAAWRNIVHAARRRAASGGNGSAMRALKYGLTRIAGATIANTTLKLNGALAPAWAWRRNCAARAALHERAGALHMASSGRAP